MCEREEMIEERKNKKIRSRRETNIKDSPLVVDELYSSFASAFGNADKLC